MFRQSQILKRLSTQHINRSARALSRQHANAPLTENFTKLQQPIGVQTLLNDSNLHDTYKRYLDRATYSATLQPLETAWTMPPEIYKDRAFAQIEQEKVFKRTWTAVAHKDDGLRKHGDVLSTFIGDVPILITVDSNNSLRGFYNVCRHRGSVLLKEGKYSQCTVIRCPYHSWTYSCNGKLSGTPYFNDARMPKNKRQRADPSQINATPNFNAVQFKKADYGLFEIGVKEALGTIYANLDSDVQRRESLFEYQLGDLAEHYGYYPFEEMRVVSQFDYTIKANYKLIAENFIEYYHLPWIHPTLCEVSSVANHQRRQGRGQYTAFCTYPLTYGGTMADPDAFEPFAGLNAVDKEAGWFVQLFPNISYFIYPHHIVTLIAQPTADPAVTKERMTILMHKDITAQMKDDELLRNKVKELTDFYILVNDEDIFAVENVQKGMACSDVYRGGRLSGKFEEPVHRYQKILIDYLTDHHMKEYPGDQDFVPSQCLAELTKPQLQAK